MAVLGLLSPSEREALSCQAWLNHPVFNYLQGGTTMAIWRFETCKQEAGYRSNASVYNLIREGLWTKPVPIGQRSVGWPDAEVRAICAARIAGQTEDQIRELVSRLQAKRIEALAEV